MNIEKAIFDPQRIDKYRSIVEDQIGLERIMDGGSIFDAAVRRLFSMNKCVVHVWTPCGLDGAMIIDLGARAASCASTPIQLGSMKQSVVQSLYLSGCNVVFAACMDDLGIGLYLLSLDFGTSEVFHDPRSLVRAMGCESRSRFCDLDELQFLDQAGCAQVIESVRVPRNQDRESFFALTSIRKFAERKGIREDAVDPTKSHYVPGLETWHACEDPANFCQLSADDKASLLRWIQRSFIRASSTRSCPASSYGLKHLFETPEHFPYEILPDNGRHFYVTNGQYKGAMIAAGFLPEDPNVLNHVYRIKLSPEARPKRSRALVY